MTDEDRREPDNFILLCGTHHKVVDDQPHRYPVMVLRRMKDEHERRYASSQRDVSEVVERAPESLFSTMLTPLLLPGAIFSARTSVQVNRTISDEVRQRTDALTPFWVRDGRLYSFHDLSDPAGVFASVVNVSSAEAMPATDAWNDPDWFRRYVTLLNKSMSLHLESRGLRFDPDRNRHYFTTLDQRPRTITYTTVTGRRQPLDVVRQEHFKDGREKSVWWHQAVRLRWERIADRSWYLTIRPEFHLTSDSQTPLPPRRIGRRVTRKKSTMYNAQYLHRVHFWRWFLAEESPQLALNVGQPLVLDTALAETAVEWPGVPGDDVEMVQPTFEETLLTRARLMDALGNVADWEELIA